MLRRIYRRCAGDVLRCKMPVQPALGYSVLMSDQPHRSKGCAARMREYPAPCRMISVQPTLHQAVSAERCTERCCDGQPKSCAGHHESCTIIAYFSGTCKPRCRFPPPFSATFRLSLPQPYRPFCRWPMPRISVGGFRQPSSQRRFCCWLPLLFPSADPSRLRRRPIGIFAGFLSAGLYQEPPPRFSPVPLGQRGCYGSCPAGGCPTFGAPVLLSVIDGVAPYQNLILTKPHGSKLSLSSFYGLSHGTGQPLPQFAVPLDHMLPVAYSQRLVVPLTMDTF